jgi:L-threonylcarbamoyladenylate synthase
MENEAVEKAIEYLKKGKVGIFPTDTAFGIGCRMDDDKAVKRVYQIRNRSKEKALLVLVSSVKMAEKYVFINDEVRKELIEKYWPGALTIILKCKPEKVSNMVTANTNTLAVRLPDHEVLKKIIEDVGVPVVAPSANFSGKPTPFELSEIDERLKSKVDFILPGVCTIKGVSTIIDCTKKPWKIVREGVARISV